MSRGFRVAHFCAVSIAIAALGCTDDEEDEKAQHSQAVTESQQTSARPPAASPPASEEPPSASTRAPAAEPARVAIVSDKQPALVAQLEAAEAVTTCALDRVNQAAAKNARIARDSPAVLQGWAADVTGASVPQAVRVIFERKDIRYQGPASRGFKRPDVAAVFKNPRLANAGFRAVLDLRDVEPGKYRVKLFQVLPGGEVTLCDTKRVVTVR